MNFADQIVVVTGASRGIGRQIAESFAAEGATVACVATSLEGARNTAEKLPRAKAYACDVSEADAVSGLVEAVTGDLGTPAVLVNNAGITRDTLLLRMKDDDWDRVLAVNLRGTFLMVRGFTKSMMKARYGRIVNLASVIGQHGGPGQANYAASKAGIEGFTKAVAKELGSRGITCNAVSPGFIDTDMTADLPTEFREHVEKNAPAGRLGTVQDVATAVLFLASRDAAYITGQTLTVDGGLML
ncbi:MAG: 3-oxoacyl-[acyl-carrier-protein] reductase [Fimbriimonadaceae bacterium]